MFWFSDNSKRPAEINILHGVTPGRDANSQTYDNKRQNRECNVVDIMIVRVFDRRATLSGSGGYTPREHPDDNHGPIFRK
jgi:hypothetical protein